MDATPSTAASASPNDLHALAQQALLLLEMDEAGRYTLLPPSDQRLRRGLEALSDSPDLRYAVISLVSLAKYLDDQRCPGAADVLLKIAASAVPALRNRGAADARLADDLTQLTTRKFAAFTGTEIARVAPKHGVKAGPGTFSIGSLNALKPRRA